MITKTKYLIIGQGLAGTSLAHHFAMNNIDFLILDNNKNSTSSKVAPGVCNPVVFKRHTPTWKATETFDYLNNFYSQISTLLNEQLFSNINILVRINEKDKADFWRKKAKSDKLNKYMSPELLPNLDYDYLNQGIGYGMITGSGLLDTNTYLNKSKTYFETNNNYIEDTFNYDNLIVNKHSITYKDIQAQHIIFCEGYNSISNPYFFYLQFKLTKGEIITVKIDDFSVNEILKVGIGVIPRGNNIFTIGATYDWHDITATPSQHAKTFLSEKLSDFLNRDYEIISHQAGIRPTVKDRRPLLGTHPEYTNMHIFNGLGTKGVALSPYFSEQMFSYLENGELLDTEVNINRFK